MTLRSLIAAFAGVLLLFWSWIAAVAQEPKSLNGVALIIGQSEYRHIDALPNPANDARDMSKLLTDLGFDARSVTDRDAAKLRRDLERFEEDAEGADVALIYYSGHGIEAGGENWLVPVDADLSSLDDAGERLVRLSAVIDSLKAKVPVTIVLLDACRTNPFPPGSMVKASPDVPPAAVGATGLALVRGMKMFGAGQKPQPANDNLGIVIGFAAEPGEPALDGEEGKNSPYASALMRHLTALKGVEFGQVMRMVTEEVYLATGTKQRPWTNESLRRLLYFGLAPAELQGTEGKINGERRQLLLTMADLPSAERIQVERVALREGVKLDALYGVLRAMGTEVTPKDPDQFGKLLEGQVERLREMTAQRDALRPDDPEGMQLALAAERAIGEGAIESALDFRKQIVARDKAKAEAVNQVEQQLKDVRLSQAASLVDLADTHALLFDFSAAAANYAEAYDLAEKWDDKLAWNYKNHEAEALRSQGDARGDKPAFEKSIAAYKTLLNMLPNGEKNADWAMTINKMALSHFSLGIIEQNAANLEKALAMFGEAQAVFSAIGDESGWAKSAHNSAGVLLTLGSRKGDPALTRQGLATLIAVLEKRPRATHPREWAQTQGAIGQAEYQIAAAAGDVPGLIRSEAAYLAAIDETTMETDPIVWGGLQLNLGNTLNELGLARNEVSLHHAAAAAFEASMKVRTRENWPQDWAASQVNLGNAYSNISRHERGTAALEKARQALEGALGVYQKAATPIEWASAQSNLAAVMQTIGQRTGDVAILEKSYAALVAAREIYDRDALPLKWAATQMNAGNTLHLIALFTDDIAYERRAVEAYRNALLEYRRERTQLLWAQTNSNLALALQNVASAERSAVLYGEAIAAQRGALEVLTPDNAPVDWANAQTRLGTCLTNLADIAGKPELMAEARVAFEASMLVFTKEAAPVQWAHAQNSIGDIHLSQASAGGGKAEGDQAANRFEAAREMFVSLGKAQDAALLDAKIKLVRVLFN